MSKLTSSQKAERVLRLLLGIRNPRICEALAGQGFASEDLEKGWILLRSVARSRLDALNASPDGIEPSVLADLDRWQSRWFAVAEVVLCRHYPRIAQKVFAGLCPAEGPRVVQTLETLIKRLRSVFDATDDESRAAVARLAQKGLTQHVVGQAWSLLDGTKLRSSTPGVSSALSWEPQVEHERAEQELWDWYVSWSRVALAAITERTLLRAIGLSTRAKTALEPNEDEMFELITTGAN
jgi:hypothetical protein